MTMQAGAEAGVAGAADVVAVTVPAGGRVLVVSDLHLGRTPTVASTAATTELARRIEGWAGPAVLVFAGDLIELLAEEVQDSATALAAHPRLTGAVQAFAAEPGRRVVVLAGNHDGRLAWDAAAARRVGEVLRCEIGLAAVLEVHTGAGVRRVRIEHGHRFDPPNAFTDPRNSADTPLGHHVVREILPLLQGPGAAWLAGVEHLADPVEFPAFVASRLAYRRLARHARWLAVPFVLAVLLKVPLLYALLARGGHGAGLASWRGRLVALGLAVTTDAALVAAGLTIAARRTWASMGTLGLGRRGPAQNDVARDTARALVDDGLAGLVTGHTHHAELTAVGTGFYANTGCGTKVVEEAPARLGLPPVFLAHRQVSWVELEAGAELHVRLLHARCDAAGSTTLERLACARRPPYQPRPVPVAAFPEGPSWPPVADGVAPARRVRRIAALAIAGAGLLDLVSALTPPMASRLHAILRLVPLAVPQAAAALVALSGLALLSLSRGIRRGQRHAWTLSVLLLAGTGLLHLLKGGDVEESVAAFAAAAYLVHHRSAFSARLDRPSFRRGLLGLLAGGAAATLVGALATESVRGPHGRLPVGLALAAAGERLVGITAVAVPGRVDEFLAPGLGAVGLGLALAGGWLLFRPVVSGGSGRRDASPTAQAREIVLRHGRDSLAYFALRDDKQHFFWGDSLVAYAVFGGVCLVSPDPVGPVCERPSLWAAFLRFADAHGWALAVLGASEEWLATYRASGMHDLYVGDEGVVDCTRFSLEGGTRKGLRQAVNRVAKYGYTIGFFDPAALAPELDRGLRDVMAKSRRGGVERGFSMTLGRAFHPADHGLLLAVCFAPDGKPVAFCQYVPAPGIGGYSLDLMRRSAGDHPNGLTDFVVVETIRHLRRQGHRGLALNFATMRAVLAGEAGDGVTQRVERWLLRSMSDSMQIESLWRYNAKFDPDWHPRYAVFDVPENVLPAALAVARAESFWELPLIGRFLVPPPPAGEVCEGREVPV